MFPVFASLLLILKSVSRCLCPIVKQPWTVSREFVKQETKIADLTDSFHGVRHSVYLGIQEKQISVSFFLATIFGRIMLYRANSLSEFRIVLSQIGSKDSAANSPYIMPEWIRRITSGAKPNHSVQRLSRLPESRLCVGLRIFFRVFTASHGSILA